AETRGLGPVRSVMVAPVPADPFEGFVVVDTPDAYLLGHWSWLARERFTLDERRLPKLGPSPVLDAASATPEARRFLAWSRYPYFEIETTAEGFAVRFADARYATMGGIAGPIVRLDRALRPLGSATPPH
ncbi:MAG TPA: hypothetical protein VFV10_02660, partial [Gammaproteobacteria bacterium]|nr:hypothetical protein [Gammaproteobacteria bacterium]